MVDQYVIALTFEPTSTQLLLRNTDSTFTLIEGTGFTFDGNRNPTGGLVTSITRLTNDTLPPGVGNTLETISTIANYSLVTLAGELSAANTNFPANVLAGADEINGGSLDDTLFGFNGNDTITGFGGSDVMTGGLGDDTYVVDSLSDTVTESANQGTDEVETALGLYVLGANVENLTYTGVSSFNGVGNTLNNLIIGGAAADSLVGDAGNDTLDGGADADTLSGGAGNDTYIVDNTGDSIAEAAADGTDLVRTSVDYTLATNLENMTYDNGMAADDQFAGTGNSSNNTIIGGNNASGDTLSGLIGNDTLRGGEGTDGLSGGAGNDTLEGTALDGTDDGDSDFLEGGTDNDTYVVGSGDTASEAANEGTDTVRSVVGEWLLEVNVENLTYDNGAAADAVFRGIGNTQANVITGGNAANGSGWVGDPLLPGGIPSTNGDLLAGGIGNDTLNGLGGDDILLGDDEVAHLGRDTMLGGLGSDFYFIDHVADVVTELGGQGTDSVVIRTDGLTSGADVADAVTSYTLVANVENLFYDGSLNFTLTGNNLDNEIAGSTGNDTIDGGAGADLLEGQDGNDTYIVDNAGDVVEENGGEGTDEVRSRANVYALTAGQELEKLTFIGTGNFIGFGNEQQNELIGGAGNDTLDGGADSDILRGGLGNDTYIVDAGDTVFESTGEGTDLIITEGSTYSLNSEQLGNVENLTYDNGDTGDPGTSTSDDDDVFVGTGNALNNIIIGGFNTDSLSGEGGNDTLDGRAGADNLVGGEGNDTYIVDDSGDLVTEVANEGTDTVRTALSAYTLTANVENLVYTGTGAIAGNGNASNNTLNGGAGNDVLNGLGGADTQVGGAGNDVFHFDVVGDTAVEAAGGGTDLVRTLVSINALGANIENVQLNGVGNFLVVGNELNNTMNGNSGINQLRGLAGNDLLFGFDGNDVILGGAGRDQMAGGNGNDAFHFDALADMSVGSTRDIITDFAVGLDDLDFNTMDANSVLAGNQNFAWRGTQAFSAAGQLRFVQVGGNTIVQGNLDNNLTTVEFEVQLNGLKALTAGDTVL